MTDKEYLQKMIALTNELERIANHEPLVQDSWDMYINEMHMVTCEWHATRYRWPRFFVYAYWFLLGVLAWVILSISC